MQVNGNTNELKAIHNELLHQLREAEIAEGIAERFANAETSQERLEEIQKIGQLYSFVPKPILAAVFPVGLADADPRVRGETCYVLGRTENPQVRTWLNRMLDDEDDWVRGQAQDALKKLSHEPDMRKRIETLRDQIDGLRSAMQPGLELGLAAKLLDEYRRNERAYRATEEQLLEAHSGRFAVFCDGKLVHVADTREEAIAAARLKQPQRPYIREIGSEIPERDKHRR